MNFLLRKRSFDLYQITYIPMKLDLIAKSSSKKRQMKTDIYEHLAQISYSDLSGKSLKDLENLQYVEICQSCMLVITF